MATRSKETPSGKKLDSKASKNHPSKGYLPQPAYSNVDAGGVDFSESTFNKHAAILGDPRLGQRMYSVQRASFVLRLQSDYGNQYVQRLVDHVTRKSEDTSQPDEASRHSSEFYHQVEQRLSAHSNQTLQGKLVVGPADDKHERHADEVAKRVVGEIRDAPQQQGAAVSQELQRDSFDELEEEELIQAKPLDLQRQIGLEGGEVEADVEQSIQSTRGQGRALPDDVRASMESSLSSDFSGVKVHTGSESDTLNRELGSRAFTTGSDIFIRHQDYSPSSSKGQELLAHELTHVVQQGAAGLPRQLDVQSAPSGEDIGLDRIQRNLIPESQQAFKTATMANLDYAEKGVWTRDYMPEDHQKKLIDVTGWWKKITSAVAGLFKKKSDEPSPFDKLKDFLRAFLLGKYAYFLDLWEAKPETKALTEEEKEKKRNSTYLPKALENRDKFSALLSKGIAAPETRAFLRDENFEGALPITEEEASEAANGPRIDVRGTYWGSKWLKLVGQHLFIVYTDEKGEQWYFRGEPDTSDPPMTTASWGKYDSNTIDFDPSAPSKTVLMGDKAASKVDALIEATGTIKRMKVPYVAHQLEGLKISGENCNASAWTILDRAGVPKSKPSGLYPGWGHELGDFLGEGEKVDPEEADPTSGDPYEICLSEGAASLEIYRDRGKVEEIGKLPDETRVSLLRTVDDMARVRTEGGMLGWVDSGELIREQIREVGRPFKIAGDKGTTVMTLHVVAMANAAVPVEGGQIVEVLDSKFKVGDPEVDLVKIRYSIGTDEYEARVWNKDLVALATKEAETVEAKPVVISDKYNILRPASDSPVAFLDMFGGDTHEGIDVPTRIKVLDSLYPDGLEGWENVHVLNIDSGVEGHIGFGDLKAHLT